jgi:hypothetical protein
MSTETRTHLTYLYPGSLFPEESAPVRVEVISVEEALRHSPDDVWFAAEFTTTFWRRWESDGAVEWRPMPGGEVVKRRVYVGAVLSEEGVRALPGDHSILLSHMRCNDWARVVQTRAGNFQPFRDHDFIQTAEELT